MSSIDSGVNDEGLMSDINALFAPPTLESYGKKGLPGIVSLIYILFCDCFNFIIFIGTLRILF